ncbi:putative ribonuclease H-like domain-containing protein [Tanacetum coccineum]|uniref:Ribonuclease H-like domain-containing protein n=1 Tax=Tanacetum coccineum TaxID=301880 RepID=A0ABQ5GAK3_9ASTR
MIRCRYGKTPYELLHDKPPNLSYLHVFGALCYPTNDCENLGKLQPKADIGIFIGYAPTKKAFRIYNRRTRRIIETIHVDFDELTAMASEHSSSGPALHEMTPDLLFQPMFDESLNPPPYVDLHAPEVIAPIPEVVAHEHAVSTGSPSSTIVDQDAPSPSNSHTTQETQTPIISHDVEEDNHDIEVAHMGNDPYFGILIPEVTSDQSSSSDVIHTHYQFPHGLQSHEPKALFCYYDAFLTSVEPKNYKDALTQACWIEAMQEELHEFERLKVWELVPPPDKALVITLKWIYKVKLDELGAVDTPMVGEIQTGKGYKEGKKLCDHGWLQVHVVSTSGSTTTFMGDLTCELSFLKAEEALRILEYQLADIFTKALGRERIEFLINKLGMRSFTPETLKKLADDVDEYQNQRDLPRDIPLDSVVVLRYEKRSKSENKGKVPTEMELVLEQTQQGTSYEVSVSAEGVEELKRKVKITDMKVQRIENKAKKGDGMSANMSFPRYEVAMLMVTAGKSHRTKRWSFCGSAVEEAFNFLCAVRGQVQGIRAK